MTSPPPPNPEREKEYQRLQAKATDIYNCIQTSLGEDVSVFDLVGFSAWTLLKALPLFPDRKNEFLTLMRDLVTISLEAQKSIELGTNQVEERKKKALLYDARGNEL